MPPDSTGLKQAASTETSRENHLWFVLSVCMRRWKLITCTTLGAGLIYWLVSLYMWPAPQENYNAHAILAIEQSPFEGTIVEFVEPSSLLKTTPRDLVTRVREGEVAKDVVQAMIDEDVASGRAMGGVVTDDEFNASVRGITRALSIEPVDQTRTIRVSALSTSAREAARIVEYATRSFIEKHAEYILEGEQSVHVTVQEQIEDLRGRLDGTDGRLLDLRREMGFRTHEQVAADIKTIGRQIVEADTTRVETDAKMAEIEAQLREKKQGLPKALGQITDDVVTQLVKDLDNLVRKKAEMEVWAEPAHPDFRDLEAEILEKKTAILDALRKLDSGIGGGTNLWEERQNLRRQHVDLQLQMTALGIRTSTQVKLMAQLEERLPELAEKDKEYQHLVRESNHLRERLTRLLDAEFDVRTAIGQRSGQLERRGGVETSLATGMSRSVKRWMNFVIGALLGLVGGVCLALLWESLDTSFRTTDDVTTHLALEVIGTIPLMRFGRMRRRKRGDYVPVNEDEQVDACIVTQHDPKSPISEAYKSLRTNFQFATLTRKPKTIMVTSATPGEGKTTTAVNLAVTFADSALKVLIIDTDLRRPHVHHVLKMKRGPGLADVLREGLDVHTVIRSTRVKNLYTISSGHVPPNPSELIGSQRMESLMTQLRQEFDVIICDAPSLLVVTDPVLLAAQLDTIILVVAVNWARRETVLRSKKLLETANSQVAGVVLNGLEATR
ncbi:MAG: polysaccharide biosynthesis tyrosine autokinase, partial [bacterium]|nr:polysaccharide biosynthesis tyrosine autokinase [bacterium]